MTNLISDPQMPTPALILFGQDAAGRPRAAWFDLHEAEDAERASGSLGYAALRVTTEQEQAFAARLPHGRLCANGKPLVRSLPRPLFQALHQLALSGSSSANAAEGGPEPERRAAVDVGRPCPSPQDWQEIGNGSLVLAYDPSSKAWYEAVVVNTLNDALRLTWRDYPEEGIITRKRNQLALLCPAA